MIIFEYHPDGELVPDVKALEYAQSFVERANEPNQMHEVKFAQAIVLDAIRVLIKRGVIDKSLVSFKYQNQMMYPDSGGRLDAWPRGFCDHTEDFLMEMM